jgi:hypothetical protein
LKNTQISPEQWQKLVNTASKEVDEQEAQMILSGKKLSILNLILLILGILFMFKIALRERIEPDIFQETCENLTIVGEKQTLLVSVYRNMYVELSRFFGENPRHKGRKITP